MPKHPIDYQKNIIYKIVCDDLTVKECYVGHTTDFTKRKCKHKHHTNNKQSKEKKYETIRINGGWENWSMIEIEKYPCKDQNEARARERHWVEVLNATLNSHCPFRVDRKEICKASYEKLKDKQSEKTKCDLCERTMRRDGIYRHKKYAVKKIYPKSIWRNIRYH